MRISLISAPLRVSAILALSLALGLTTGCHRDPNKEKQRYLESGKRYADQGKYKEATIQFANALKVDRNFAAAHYELSKVLFKQGSMMTAYGELMRTIDLQPNNVQARIDLGNLLIAGKQTARAAEQANAVWRSTPTTRTPMPCSLTSPPSKETRQPLLTRFRRPWRSPRPRDIPCFSWPAAIRRPKYGSRRRRAASQSCHTRRQECDDSSPARIAPHEEGDAAGAEAQTKAAVVADPKSLVARASLADLYMKQNDNAKAEQTLRQAAEDMSDSGSGAGLLATYYIRTNQLSQGENAYADLVAKHPKSASLKTAYLRLLILNKDLPRPGPSVPNSPRRTPISQRSQSSTACSCSTTARRMTRSTSSRKRRKPIPTILRSKSGSAAQRLPKAI